MKIKFKSITQSWGAKQLKNPILMMFITLIASCLCVNISRANPYGIPASASPGAIMNHNLQYEMLRNTTPEFFGPTGRNGINKANPYDRSPVYAENGVDSISPGGDNSTFGIMKTPHGDAYVVGPSE